MSVKIFFLPVILLIITCCAAPLSSAGEIPTIEWGSLRDKDISPEGKAALSTGGPWAHAETDHFIYHFTDAKLAETVHIHAEVYYKWIKDFFGIAKDRWAKKSHIFIFTDEKAWNDFLIRIRRSRAEAFTSGWELFIYRAPHWAAPRWSLAHEITHVILFRFLSGPIPLFLNEGFAEYVSWRVLEMQLDGSGYAIAPIKPIPQKDFIRLKELAGMETYSEGRMQTFYRESALLVRFLVFNYKNEKFYELLRRTSDGEGFQKALAAIYETDLETIEQKFRASGAVE